MKNKHGVSFFLNGEAFLRRAEFETEAQRDEWLAWHKNEIAIITSKW